jgi:hypothetical protein
LHNVLELVLKATIYAPLGIKRWGYESLGLSAHQMLLLKHVHLEWIFICLELVDFILSNLTTLESASLHDCKGSPGSTDLDESCLPWRLFFRAISNAKPSKLRQFTVTSLTVVPEVEITPIVREVMQSNPERGMFQYSYLEEEDGWVLLDEEEIIDSFLSGEDDKAYDELMAIINANASRLSRA